MGRAVLDLFEENKISKEVEVIPEETARSLFSEKDSFALIKEFLNKYEYLCAAINVGIINDKYAYRVHAGRVISTFTRYKKFIKHARLERQDHELYSELESVADRWKSMESLEDDKLWRETLYIPCMIPFIKRLASRPFPESLMFLKQLSSEAIDEYQKYCSNLSSKPNFISLRGVGDHTRASYKLHQRVRSLPRHLRKKIIKKYFQFIRNFNHQDLQLQEVYRNTSIYSIRIGKGYRAFCKKHKDQNNHIFIWFWVGSHLQYKELLHK